MLPSKSRTRPESQGVSQVFSFTATRLSNTRISADPSASELIDDVRPDESGATDDRDPTTLEVHTVSLR